MNTELMQPQTAEAMVSAFQLAAAKLAEARRLSDEAQTIFENAFGAHSWFYTLTNQQHVHSAADLEKHNLSAAWRAIMQKTDMRRLMSTQRAEQMDKNIEEGKVPPLTVSAIFDTLQSLIDGAPQIYKESIAEAYNTLRPGAGQRNKLKTNEKFGRYDIGKKVILLSMVNTNIGYKMYQNLTVRYNQTDTLRVIDKAFHNLDGKPFTDGYLCPLVDAINTAKDGEGETEYFKFKAYYNGNLHLEFKRPDLLVKLNQIGGDGSLKG